MAMSEMATRLRPGEFSRQALAMLSAADGRRRRRARDTTPDAIGLALKRDLLERAAQADPAPEAFEGWLLEQVLRAPVPGPVRAVCGEILAEYRVACLDPAFHDWLTRGAPSADAGADAAGAPADGERRERRRQEMQAADVRL
jgi:hypothetical protein